MHTQESACRRLYYNLCADWCMYATRGVEAPRWDTRILGIGFTWDTGYTFTANKNKRLTLS